MSYHPGTCYWPVGFDYSPAGIAKVPAGTVRKFGGTWHDGKFGYMEGVRIKAFQDAGKRVIGTYTVSDPTGWAMPDADWQGYIERFIADCPTLKVVEIGNEMGKSMTGEYLNKLQIASRTLRAAGLWVLMGAPYPGAEGAFWEAMPDWGLVDGVCCHPYAKTPADSLTKVRGFRVKLNGVGAVAKHIHLTEFGWPTKAPPQNPFVVSEAIQAQYVAQAFRNWKANAAELRLNNCLYYTLNDGYGPDYGVIRADGTKKPAYLSLSNA